MTAGLDRKVKLFDVKHSNDLLDFNGDEDRRNYNNVKSTTKSKKIQGIFIPDLPVFSAKFLLDGQQAIFTGNRKHYYTYHIEKNKLERLTIGTLDQKNLSSVSVASKDFLSITSQDSGEAHLFSQQTKKHLFSLKMNGSCTASAFSTDSLYLFTVGDQAEVYWWDLRMQRCLGKIGDEGNFSTTAIDVSPDGKWLATGSKLGTVNVFSLHDVFSGSSGSSVQPKPHKTIMNLTTSVTEVKFGPTSQCLAFCSKWKKNAFKLLHIPSFTVFQNFPGTAPGVLKYPFCLDFEKSTGEYIAMGNDEGRAHLWHMPYFR